MDGMTEIMPPEGGEDHKGRERTVGRDRELALFREQLQSGPGAGRRLLNVYGTGGVGKSHLLDEFRRLTRLAGGAFYLLNSRDFPPKPQEFCLHLLRLAQPEADDPAEPLPRLAIRCQRLFSEAAARGKTILALDTFEEMGELEGWLRDEFLPGLHPDIFLIVSGRYPLQSAWLSSPGWRRAIIRLPLSDLDYFSVRDYLLHAGIQSDEAVHQIWLKTKGHPLTLSLFAATTLTESWCSLPGYGSYSCSDRDEVFDHVVRTWLKEVPDAGLRELVEATAVLGHFNQELLAFVLDREVPTDLFRRLTGLSFIRRVDRGWLLHDLMRDAVCSELRARAPSRFGELWSRCVLFTYNRIMELSARKRPISWECSEWFYYVGDHLIREFFYQRFSPIHSEPLSPANWSEAEAYIRMRHETAQDAHLVFYHPDTGERTEYYIKRRESLLTLRHVHLEELYALDPGIVRLIRGPQGSVIGLSAIIPINGRTLDYLRTEPLSACYFGRLNESQLKEMRVAPDSRFGYFVKTIDIPNFADHSMRTAAGLTFMSLMLSAGFIVAAPPANPFFQSIHVRLGCEETKDILHTDYDGVTPTPLFVLDTRGAKLHQYLNRMLASFGLQPGGMAARETAPEPEQPLLTERERCVVRLTAEGKTNQEIANELYIEEVTVKKHLTAIFRKLEVKSRTQLIHKLQKRI
ncbi:LuxR C-terminal-related transcriptional regulator [Gorillibacterium sp. sgz5001074]|uniref:helix-turn-helix domain-containing protein n=1 Tax=Gorillibacterium sp. sgz5001074 TaxID=3446695 RepID=UPI003F6807DA